MMKVLLHSVFLFAFAAATGPAALAQQVVPPPPPADAGPSLAVTLQFLQTKINETANVTYIESNTNTLTNETSGPFKHSNRNEVTSVDPAGALSVVWTHDWPVPGRTDVYRYNLRFHDVQSIEVMSFQDKTNRDYAQLGKPEYRYDYSPQIFVLVVHMVKGKNVPVHFKQVKPNEPDKDVDGQTDGTQILISDEDSANRVAKAMIRAIELTGGGGAKDPF